MSINQTKRKRDKFNAALLSAYYPRHRIYMEAKNKLSDNAKSFYKTREKNY